MNWSLKIGLMSIIVNSCVVASLFVGSGDDQRPGKYELKLIYIFEGEKPEYVFVIGNSGFRSVESLKQFLGHLPRGSELTWAPGCEIFGNEPLLSSEKEMKSFRLFLEGKGIKFVLVPSG